MMVLTAEILSSIIKANLPKGAKKLTSC